MKWCPFEFIGRTFGEDREIPSFTDPTDFESGLIVDSGICYMRVNITILLTIICSQTYQF